MAMSCAIKMTQILLVAQENSTIGTPHLLTTPASAERLVEVLQSSTTLLSPFQQEAGTRKELWITLS